MADHGSLGSLLQGVSQQPAHIRNDGQLTEQINMLSDVVLGLSTRPGSKYVSTLDIDTDFKFMNLSVEDNDYQIGYKAGQLIIIDEDGNLSNLVVEDDALTYIGDDMSAYTYDNVVYIVNRDKVVLQDPTNTTAQDEVITDIGLVTCLGGLFSHTYSVTVEYANGTKLTASYTCPDGTEDGDAAKTTSDFIIARLAAGLRGQGSLTDDYDFRADRSQIDVFGTAFDFTALPDDIVQTGTPVAGTVIQTAGDTLMIKGVPGIKLSVEDGSGGDILRKQTSISKSTEDLAEFAPHGTLVKVIGLDDTEDDFWMRYEVDGDPAVGSSFGSDGVWREWVNAFETVAFDLNTMPYTLTKTGTNEFTIRHGDWQSRRTGDENTNPAPSFVGYTIRDVGGFQSRLVFVSGPNLIMSRTNIPSDFYSQSVVASTATDPIDILSTSEDDNLLQWIVPFDRDLVLFGNNAQFVVTGANVITPDNASMVQTTTFDSTLAVKPVNTGRTLLFPFSKGAYSGIKEKFSVNSTEANTASTITRLQDRYLKGQVSSIVSSINMNITLVTTDSPEQTNTIFVNQYIWDGQSKVQDAWHKWEFPFPVKNVYFDNSEIVILLDTGAGYSLCKVDLDYSDDPILGYVLCLDLNDSVQVDVAAEYNYISSAYPDLTLVQGEGCYTPGIEILSTRTGSGPYVYQISKEIAPTGATVYYGLPYIATAKPTMPFIRDRNGKVQRLHSLVVTDFVIHYDRSGYISATLSSRYRDEDVTINNEQYSEFLDKNDTDFNGTRSGQWIVPWGERSDWSELTVYSDDFRPISITEIEWIGQPLTRGRRV